MGLGAAKRHDHSFGAAGLGSFGAPGLASFGATGLASFGAAMCSMSGLSKSGRGARSRLDIIVSRRRAVLAFWEASEDWGREGPRRLGPGSA